MTLLGEVDTLADDIVTAVFNLRNQSRPLIVRYYLYPIAHCHRIGTADALQTEIALNLTINQLAIVRSNGVPAACILNDESLHSGEHRAIKQS